MTKRQMQFGLVQMCQSEGAVSVACVSKDYFCTGSYRCDMIWEKK